MMSKKDYLKPFIAGASLAVLFLSNLSLFGQDKQDAWIQQIRNATGAGLTETVYAVPGGDAVTEAQLLKSLALLSDKNPSVRKAIAIQLGEIRAQPSLVVPRLVKLIGDKDENVREQAIVALAKYDTIAAAQLIQLLGRTQDKIDPKIRIGKDGQTTLFVSDLAMIGLIDSRETVVPYLFKAYKANRTPLFRRMVTYVLARNKYKTPDDLLPYLTDADPDIQILALNLLGYSGARAETAIPPVAKLLQDNNAEVRSSAFACLCRIGPKALAAITTALANKPGQESQFQVVQNIRHLGVAGIPLLLNIISTGTNDTLRAAAANQVAEIKYYSPEVGEVLSKAMLDPNLDVARLAANSLEYVSTDSTAFSKSTVLNIISALKSPFGEVQNDAASLLGGLKNFHGYAAMAQDELLKGLALPPTYPLNYSFSGNTRQHFIEAVGHIAINPSRAIPVLQETLSRDSLAGFTNDVVETLGKFGPLASSLVPLIIQRFDKIGPYEQAAYFNALARIQPRGMDSLLAMLKSKQYHMDTKFHICTAISSSASLLNDTVVRALQAITQSKDSLALRVACAIALYHLGNHKSAVEQLMVTGLEAGIQTREIYENVTTGVKPDPVLLDRIWNDPKIADRSLFMKDLAASSDLTFTNKVLVSALLDKDDEISSTASELLMEEDPAALKKLMTTDSLSDHLAKVIAREISKKKNFDTWVKTGPGSFSSVAQPVFPALDMIEKLGPDARSLLPTLKPLLNHPDKEIRLVTARSIGRIGLDTLQLKPVLLKLLDDSDKFISQAASRSLVQMHIDIDTLGQKFTSNVIDNYIKSHFAEEYIDLADYFRPSPLVSGRIPPGLPPFPWPPPKYSNSGRFGVDLPMALIGNDTTRLYSVYLKLTHAMKAVDANFEEGLFGAPGGIALLTKIERINQDGKPLPGKYRWMTGKIPPLDLTDYIGQLFFEQSGYFREIAFVFTDEQNFGTSNKSLPDIKNGGDFPAELMHKTLKDLHGYVFIYSFKRVNGGSLTSFDRLSATVHLEDSGIFRNISTIR